ncbi:MAG TPA: CHAT domain-containing protein [Actinocrinis sp.]|nr:CHAT domain-containing protein [Actinocrinis sp.]
MARHRRGLAANAAGHPNAAAEHFRAGLRILGPEPAAPRASALAARLLLSLAHAEAEQGRVEQGLDLVARAEVLAADEDRGIVLSQRALLQWRVGRYRDALPVFDQSVALLADHPDPIVLARVLLNRGGLQMAGVRLTPARVDLARCERIAREHGADLIADKAVNGLGFCELLAGNIPAALDLLGRAEAGYRAHGPGNVPIAQVDRARALMAAGLAHEAAAGLASAIEAFRAQKLTQDLADAELTLAQALAAAGESARAVDQARRAERTFRARGNETGAILARLTAARADFALRFDSDFPADAVKSSSTDSGSRSGSDTASGADSGSGADTDSPSRTANSRSRAEAAAARRLSRRTSELADQLQQLGLIRDAALARLLSVRSLMRSGAPADRIGRLLHAAVPRGISVPLETRLSAHLARAELAVGRGDRATAYAELRKGLAELHAHRRALGSLDLQTGVAALGRELTRTGLRLALASGSVRAVFAWSERSRAQALRVRPVRPPDDPRTAEAVAELRHLDRVLRTAELEGRTEPAARQRHAALRRGLLEESWKAGGTGPGRGPAPAGLAEVAAELGGSGHRMISLLRHGDQLLALLVDAGGARLVPLGGYRRATEAAQRLAGDLDARMARRLPERLQEVIDQSIRRQLGVLTDEILAPLRPPRSPVSFLPDDDAPLVLVPTGALSAVPWALLPELRQRSLTVAPSAEMWLAARRARESAAPSEADPSPVLAAGPRLAHADGEVSAIARLYPDPRVLTGKEATVEATLRAMDGARTVHLAAHGHHERGNVLFARVDLADGPLMAYDLQRLSKPPRCVVLSACEVGRADVRSGDEHLGFTAALLHAGTATVISSGAQVSDDSAPLLMTALHRAVAAGTPPALALAGAAAPDQFNPFVCFGAG